MRLEEIVFAVVQRGRLEEIAVAVTVVVVAVVAAFGWQERTHQCATHFCRSASDLNGRSSRRTRNLPSSASLLLALLTVSWQQARRPPPADAQRNSSSRR